MIKLTEKLQPGSRQTFEQRKRELEGTSAPEAQAADKARKKENTKSRLGMIAGGLGLLVLGSCFCCNLPEIWPAGERTINMTRSGAMIEEGKQVGVEAIEHDGIGSIYSNYVVYRNSPSLNSNQLTEKQKFGYSFEGSLIVFQALESEEKMQALLGEWQGKLARETDSEEARIWQSDIDFLQDYLAEFRDIKNENPNLTDREIRDKILLGSYHWSQNDIDYLNTMEDAPLR